MSRRARLAPWVLATLLAGVGCDGEYESPTYPAAQAAAVQPGMTKAQVVGLLGRPHHMFVQDPNGIVEIWAYVNQYREERFQIGFDADGNVVRTETVSTLPPR